MAQATADQRLIQSELQVRERELAQLQEARTVQRTANQECVDRALGMIASLEAEKAELANAAGNEKQIAELDRRIDSWTRIRDRSQAKVLYDEQRYGELIASAQQEIQYLVQQLEEEIGHQPQ